MVDFLNDITIGPWCAHRFDDTVEPGNIKTRLWCLWNGQFALNVQTSPVLLFLLWKRRNYPSKDGLSSKEIQFGVPIIGWKLSAWNNCSESKRQHVGIYPTTFWRILWGKQARVAILSIDAFGWAIVFPLSWIHFATKSLQISCCWCLVIGQFFLIVWTTYVLLIPETEKKKCSC